MAKAAVDLSAVVGNHPEVRILPSPPFLPLILHFSRCIVLRDNNCSWRAAGTPR